MSISARMISRIGVTPDYEMDEVGLANLAATNHLSLSGFFKKQAGFVDPNATFVHWSKDSRALSKLAGRSDSVRSFLKALRSIPLESGGFYKEAVRFASTLILYDEYVKDAIYSGLYILRRSLADGPSFADHLKDLRECSIKRTMSYVCTDYADSLGVDIKSWDAVFPAELVFNFQRECDDDYEYLFEDKPATSKAVLDAFRQEATKLFKTSEDLVEPELDMLDMLKFFGSSTCCSDVDFKSLPKSYRWARDPDPTITDTIYLKKSPVYKNPAEMRAAVLPSTNSMANLTLVERLIGTFWKGVPGDCYFNDRWSSLKEWLSDTRCVYMQSDQKKCGLTFNRDLIIILLEIIGEHYPNWKSVPKLIASMKEIWLIDDGRLRRTTRGFGLGMCNGAVSVCVAILYKAWKKHIIIEDDSIVLSGIFFGDDQTIKVRSTSADLRPSESLVDTAMKLQDSWEDCMSRAGLYVHKKKPFLSKQGQFCEIYGKHTSFDVSKVAKRSLNLLYGIRCHNIVDAKEFVSSVASTVANTNMKFETICMVASFYRSQAYQTDHYDLSIPYEVGGWVKLRTQTGMNPLLEYIARNCSDGALAKMKGILLRKTEKIQKDKRYKVYKNNLKRAHALLGDMSHNDHPKLDIVQMMQKALDAPNRNTKGYCKRYDKELLRIHGLVGTCKRHWGDIVKDFFDAKLDEGKFSYIIPPSYEGEDIVLAAPLNTEGMIYGSPYRLYLKICESLELIDIKPYKVKMPIAMDDPRDNPMWYISYLLKYIDQGRCLSIHQLRWMMTYTLNASMDYWDKPEQPQNITGLRAKRPKNVLLDAFGFTEAEERKWHLFYRPNRPYTIVNFVDRCPDDEQKFASPSIMAKTVERCGDWIGHTFTRSPEEYFGVPSEIKRMAERAVLLDNPEEDELPPELLTIWEDLYKMVGPDKARELVEATNENKYVDINDLDLNVEFSLSDEELDSEDEVPSDEWHPDTID